MMGSLLTTAKKPTEPLEEVVVQPQQLTGVMLEYHSKLKLNVSPHANCVTLVNQALTHPLTLSLDQFQQILMYVFVKKRKNNMDHRFDLRRSYFKGVIDLSVNVNDEGVVVWDQNKPFHRIHFGWDAAKEMCYPGGSVGSVIELFMWDHFEMKNFYAYVDWLQEIRDSNRIWEMNNKKRTNDTI